MYDGIYNITQQLLYSLTVKAKSNCYYFICSICLTGCGDTATIQKISNTNTLQESDFVSNNPEPTESSGIYDDAGESEPKVENEYSLNTSITVLGEEEFKPNYMNKKQKSIKLKTLMAKFYLITFHEELIRTFDEQQEQENEIYGNGDTYGL